MYTNSLGIICIHQSAYEGITQENKRKLSLARVVARDLHHKATWISRRGVAVRAPGGRGRYRPEQRRRGRSVASAEVPARRPSCRRADCRPSDRNRRKLTPRNRLRSSEVRGICATFSGQMGLTERPWLSLHTVERYQRR